MGKERTKGFISGLICAVFVVSLVGTAVASVAKRQLEASYSDIKITIDGEEYTPKNASGNTVEPFIIDGTTYLPVRAIADAAGYDVNWDGVDKTVILNSGTTEGKDRNLIAAYASAYEYVSNIIEAADCINEYYLIYFADSANDASNASVETFNSAYSKHYQALNDSYDKLNKYIKLCENNESTDGSTELNSLKSSISSAVTFSSMTNDCAANLRKFLASGSYNNTSVTNLTNIINNTPNLRNEINSAYFAYIA